MKINCTVTPGMFPTERLIELMTVSGIVKLFCPDFAVSESQVEVRLLDYDNDNLLVRVPECDSSGRVVTISRWAAGWI